MKNLPLPIHVLEELPTWYQQSLTAHELILFLFQSSGYMIGVGNGHLTHICNIIWTHDHHFLCYQSDEVMGLFLGLLVVLLCHMW